ncbi:MAG: flippase-like domain-containing protein [Gemmataceae bacterium]|nr:flippase-like domain-containing protein [Gemmataceae bacterium]
MKIKSLVRILGTLALLALIFRKVDLGQLANAFASMNPWYWLAATALLVTTQFISALRWKVIANVVGFGGSYARYSAYFYIGTFFNLALPTSVGGDVVRAWYLAYNMPDGPIPNRRSKAALTVLADRFSGVMVLICIAALATIFSPVELPVWVRACVGLVALVALVLLAMWPLAKKMGQRFAKVQVVLNSARVWIKNRWALLATTAMSVWVQVASVVIVLLVGRGLGLEVPWTYYFVMIPIVTLITMLPISLGGMGLREGAMVLLLSPFGVEPAKAVALSVLFFSVYAATSLIGLVYYLGIKTRPGVGTLDLEKDAEGVSPFPAQEDGHGLTFGDHSAQRRAG